MSCAPHPIEVRLGNVTLPTSQVARGMNMSIGEPRQAVAFLPLWPLNNTVVYGTNGYCLDDSPNTGAWTDTACTTFRGGAYDALASSSRTTSDGSAYPDDSAPDGSEGGSKYPAFTRVADSLTLNDNVTLAGFPLSVALSDWGTQAYTPMMGLGLGANSTLLNVLKATGKIASRSYSFFWGLSVAGSSAGSLDGSVVFGGYDRAKIAGGGGSSTRSMNPGVPQCPSQMLVGITDIVLNFPNGTDAGIFPDNVGAFVACLTPGLSTLMRIPLPFLDNMMALTNNSALQLGRSLGVYYWNMRYEAGYTPYQGDITIKLDTGLAVRIANNQLVRPHTQVDQTTGAVRVNSTGPDLLIDALQGIEATKMPQLGWQFFTAAYLHVNQDTNQFTLWQANPTTNTSLVAVDSAGREVTDVCEAPALPAASTPALPAATPSPSPSSPPRTAIIAGSVAAAVVLTVVGLLVWWLRRRRLLRTAQATQAALVHDALPQGKDGARMSVDAAQASGAGSELEADAVSAPAELSGGRYSYADHKQHHQTRYELSG